MSILSTSMFIQRGSFILLLVIGVAAYAQVSSPPVMPSKSAQSSQAPPTLRLWQNLNCFINGDVKACTANVTSDGSADSDFYYLRFGCVEKSSPELCLLFGNWSARRGQDAEEFYQKACTTASHVGCFSLFQAQTAKAKPGMDAPSLAALVQRASATYKTICDVKPAPESCVAAAERLKQMATLDQAKPCRLRLWTVAYDVEAPELRDIEEPASFAENCLAKCTLDVTHFNFAKTPVREVRGQCYFDGRPSGESQWNFGPPKAECNMREKSFTVGASNLAFYAQCNCEGRRFPEFNASIAKLGFFATAAPGTTVKILGSERWYRCGINLTPIEASAPECAENLERVRQLAKGEPSVRDYEILKSGINCKN